MKKDLREPTPEEIAIYQKISEDAQDRAYKSFDLAGRVRTSKESNQRIHGLMVEALVHLGCIASNDINFLVKDKEYSEAEAVQEIVQEMANRLVGSIQQHWNQLREGRHGTLHHFEDEKQLKLVPNEETKGEINGQR